MYIYKGVVHVHTKNSDGNCSIEYVVECAKRTSLDFVIITDHIKRKDFPASLPEDTIKDNIRIIFGSEICIENKSHLLILGEKNLPKDLDIEYLKDLYKKEDICLIAAHPEGMIKIFPPVNVPSWKYWNSPIYHSIEIWSFIHDWIKDLSIKKFKSYIKTPGRYLKGPTPTLIKKWGYLLSCNKKISIIGSLDAHLKKVPFTEYVVFPYEYLFDTILTFIITRTPLSGEVEKDSQIIINALRRGNSFIGFNEFYEIKNFRFYGLSNTDIVLPGNSLPFSHFVRLMVELPFSANIFLFKENILITESFSNRLNYTPTQKGSYWIEIQIDNKPWIITNPIYII